MIVHDLRCFRRNLVLYNLFTLILIAELVVLTVFLCLGNASLFTKVCLVIVIGVIPMLFGIYKTYSWCAQIHQLNKTISVIKNMSDQEVELFYVKENQNESENL